MIDWSRYVFEITLGSVGIMYLLTRVYEYGKIKRNTPDGEKLMEAWLGMERVKVRRRCDKNTDYICR